MSDASRAAVKAHEVSRYLAGARSEFGSDFSCSLVLTSLSCSGAKSAVTAQKEPCWSGYKVLGKMPLKNSLISFERRKFLIAFANSKKVLFS